MRDGPLFYIVVLAMLVVLGILATGIGGFARGGEFASEGQRRLALFGRGAGQR